MPTIAGRVRPASLVTRKPKVRRPSHAAATGWIAAGPNGTGAMRGASGRGAEDRGAEGGKGGGCKRLLFPSPRLRLA